MNQGAQWIDALSNAGDDAVDFPLLARAIDLAGSAILIADMHDRIVWANEAFRRMSGYRREEVVGASLALLHGERTSAGSDCSAAHPLLGHGEAWRQEAICWRPDGSSYVTEEIVTPVVDQYGVVTHFVSVLHDITQTKAAQQYERTLASQDMLTGLACRAHLLELFDHALREAQRTGRALATLFVDLDGFKAINDTHGHHIGDAVIQAVAARLQSAVRCSDTVARFGGDEFVILLPTIARRGVAKRLGRKIVRLAAEPLAIGAERHTLSASVGIAFYPDHGSTRESLLICADQAMYRAKRHGGNQYRLAGHALDAPAPEAAPRRNPGPQLVPEHAR